MSSVIIKEENTGHRTEGDKGKIKRRSTNILIDVKKEIIDRHENGVRVSDLATQFGKAKSTICTILKNREAIKKADVARGVTVITKQRSQTIEEVEKLLRIWINECMSSGERVSGGMICEKARQLHDHLVKEYPSMSGSTFKASRGWFEKFKKRSGLGGLGKNGESGGVDQVDQKQSGGFVQYFGDYFKVNGFGPQQVFNCAKTGLYWKRMPRRTYITQEEKGLPGHKDMKDRVTLLLCGNASGDFKVKPLLVYHSENPIVFQKNNVIKSKLPVVWRSNSKAWVTKQCFFEWVHEAFAPSVKAYLQENNLPPRCLLVMDDSPAHPSSFADELMVEFDFIRVKFLPLVQPVDDSIILNFKMLYTQSLFQRCFEVTSYTELTLRDFWRHHFNILHGLLLIDKAWQQVSFKTITLAWSKLWPECVPVGYFEDYDNEDSIIINDIVSLSKNMGLEVNHEDVQELLEDHKDELNSEELEHLQKHLQKAIVEEMNSVEEGLDVPADLMCDILSKWGELQSFVERYHPCKEAANHSIKMFNDNIMCYFRNILKRRQQQISEIGD